MILSAKNICKTFLHPTRTTILKNVSLELKKGSSAAIMGASGEGKTTLLHILGTLESADSGEIEICNTPVQKNINYIRSRLVGFVFQSYNLLEDCSALDNVTMPRRIAKETSFKNHGLQLLAMVGLKDKAYHMVKLLSGGEKQRLAIARAFCNDPEIIFADEPSGNLDHNNSQMIHELLIDCVKTKGKSLLVVTHNEKLSAMCDKIYLLSNGDLTQS